MKTLFLAAGVLGVLSFAASARADVVEGFNLTGDGYLTSAQLPLAPTTIDPNVLSGGLSASTSPNFNPGSVQVPAYVGPDGLVTDTGAGNVYAYFSVTPAEGESLDISALDVDVVFQNPNNVVDILYSTDGSITDAVVADAITGIGTWHGQPETADLSAISALQDIPSTETVTFFIQFVNGGYQDRGIDEANTTFANNNALEIDGTVTSAPEPASLGLIGFAAAAALIRRRRRA